MAKRKRDQNGGQEKAPSYPRKALRAAAAADESSSSEPTVTIQIVTGSYERVLHGITAKISKPKTAEQDSVQFVDTFLFNAHASAIRCLALSPVPTENTSQPQKIILASGGSDERVNLYTLSASPPLPDEKIAAVPTLAGNKILENPKNREIGSLLNHSSSITALYFPTRSKLLTAAEDNTISVARTRDWNVVSTIKAPRPKVHGRPTGDTAPPGAEPAGVNDFAVHPSMKLMLSVGRGEKCMRLWNLVTGKKAGVLNFGRDVLESVKEGKFSSGEGRKIIWDSQGEEFAVAFDRGIMVFGIDSVPRCRVVPSPLSKLHQIKYVDAGSSGDGEDELLAASTEDGRIIFYSTKKPVKASDGSDIPLAQVRAQMGGREHGQSSRIKDFEVLSLSSTQGWKDSLLIVTSASDGGIKVWLLSKRELLITTKSSKEKGDTAKSEDGSQPAASDVPQVGKVLGTYETGNRITCMTSFVMLEPRADLDLEESEESEANDVPSESSDSEENED
ncbi:hypothetical protein AJ80_05389 [Polytolypa hystricis UAMH7299]|uniref:60S ribosome biogenesis protein Mak11 n=1 Tax=Polytolypa hystricis (strain UAMH7299) TaxID=1447883 RepID=A0A2B7Y4T3_POLH7|nr:hypothetical protein AJ80_05389 [Polytolypa hystricis UAMH7299]